MFVILLIIALVLVLALSIVSIFIFRHYKVKIRSLHFDYNFRSPLLKYTNAHQIFSSSGKKHVLFDPVLYIPIYIAYIKDVFTCSSSIALFPIKALIEFVHLRWHNISQRIGSQVSHFRCQRIFNSIPNDWCLNG